MCLPRPWMNRSLSRSPSPAGGCDGASILTKIAVNLSCACEDAAVEDGKLFNVEILGL